MPLPTVGRGPCLQWRATMPENNIQPIVTLKDGKVFAGSLDVSEFFGKEHKNVLRNIENLLKKEPKLKLNFELLSYIKSLGDGLTRSYPCYYMDRTGFTILAMGFTGD